MTVSVPIVTPFINEAEKKQRTADISLDRLVKRAHTASETLKAMAHESRLVILCLLYQGEKSVSELESILELRQPTISQQLARLRNDDLVVTRRDGKLIYYSIASKDAERIVELMCDIYNI